MFKAITTAAPSSSTCSTRYRLRESCVASTTSTTSSGGSYGGSPAMVWIAISSSRLLAERLYAPGTSSSSISLPPGNASVPLWRSTVTPA